MNCEMDLRAALTNDEFELFYQPLVDVAKARWSASKPCCGGAIRRAGLFHRLTYLARGRDRADRTDRRVGPEAGLHRGRKLAGDSVKVAVNLSPVQFKSERLVLDVAAALATSGLSPRRLELEITETVMLHDTEATLAMLRQIKALGVSIAMDDFGTGYSSLSYLRKFPFDKIKIDQSFMREISDEPELIAIVRALRNAVRLACP